MVVSVAKEFDHFPVEKLPVYEAQDLTKGGDLAKIKLQDQLYTLRITRSGKLILTK
ncbi:hemin uptake protein HemP [uncultured Roseobacter sp.]|uniref:hemin uptake protein HemP n=1 Tax=uncultured Roseobacter sp. TaxID=114847 RepID=UPI00260E2224|nr:hemin uptake protein HemP [uncultured Roseobacter sp.]